MAQVGGIVTGWGAQGGRSATFGGRWVRPLFSLLFVGWVSYMHGILNFRFMIGVPFSC